MSDVGQIVARVPVTPEFMADAHPTAMEYVKDTLRLTLMYWPNAPTWQQRAVFWGDPDPNPVPRLRLFRRP